MVSLWPWRGNNSSPASFERALATLAGKISTTSTQLNSLRQRSRRLKAWWTLYAGFAYILYVLIASLVVGWRNWGAIEVSALVGGPVLIYLVRLSLNAYYDYRVSNVTGRLEDLQRERDKTIERLKASTKYNSTQNLLEKYGGVSPFQQSRPSSPTTPGGVKKRHEPGTRKESSTPNVTGERRVGIIPPPTANIPRNRPLPNSPSTPSQNEPNLAAAAAAARVSPFHGQIPSSPPDPSPISRLPNTEPGPAEFAPNAFPEPSQYAAQAGGGGSHWYDRVLDLLLGDDETLPKNRLALICSRCKLVNGQAPPGVKSLEDVGRWRCGACAAWNGQEESAKKMVLDIKEEQQQQQRRQRKVKEKKPPTISAGVGDDVKPDRDLANGGDSSSSPEIVNEGDEMMDEDDDLYVPDSTEDDGEDADHIAITEEDDEEREEEVTDVKSTPSPPSLKPQRRGGRPRKSGAVERKKS